jgi:hypothetical protein
MRFGIWQVGTKRLFVDWNGAWREKTGWLSDILSLRVGDYLLSSVCSADMCGMCVKRNGGGGSTDQGTLGDSTSSGVKSIVCSTTLVLIA